MTRRAPLHFPRPELAHELALALRGEQLFAGGPNGLFLAAPRRTGKSTFLQQDLASALRNGGAVVVYVDLWADQRRDPADVLSEAIAAKLDRHRSLPRKRLEASGIGAPSTSCPVFSRAISCHGVWLGGISHTGSRALHSPSSTSASQRPAFRLMRIVSPVRNRACSAHRAAAC